MGKKERWVCCKCRGQNIETTAMINPNTGQIVALDPQSRDDSYCNDCDENAHIEAVGIEALAHWAMYQKLGGTRGADEYANMAAMFFRMTSSAYIFGCASAYGDDRAECMASYRQWIDTHYNGEDVVRIFDSIDMVSSYS